MQYLIYFPLVALLGLAVYLVVEYQTTRPTFPLEEPEEVIEEEPEVEKPQPVKKKPGRPKKSIKK